MIQLEAVKYNLDVEWNRPSSLDLNHFSVYPMRVFMETRHDSEHILLSACLIFFVDWQSSSSKDL